jgi:sugar phosphate isomerase/epimerase
MNVSVRDLIVPVEPGESFFRVLRTIGADSIEVAVNSEGDLPHLPTPDGRPHSLRDEPGIEALRTHIDSENVRISALLLATDFSGTDARRHVDWVIRTARAARSLDIPVLRVDPWTANESFHPESIRQNVINCIREALDGSADTGTDIGIENHGRVFNDPDVLDDLLKHIPDERFGLTLDTGNFYWWGHPASEVYELVAKYAPRAKHTHIKNINYPPALAESRREIGCEYKTYCCPLDEGNLNLRRVVSALRNGGYARDLCVEDESLFKFAPAERASVLKREVDALRTAAR